MSRPDPGLERLLAFVKEHRGFDFTGYKRTTLERRVRKRMDAVQLSDYDAYLKVLANDPDEYASLFDSVLINVTRLFRDADVWELVERDVIPRILAAKSPEEPVRVWVPGCATGEEALTIAMLFCEAMGEEAFRDRMKIFATDVDLDALRAARSAVFARSELEEMVGVERTKQHFAARGDQLTFRPDLGRAIIFGRHDLVQDPPISRIDFLSCRNTLMYFTSPAQVEILVKFAFSLRPTGFLLLGHSEAIGLRTSLFMPYDVKSRLSMPRPSDRESRGLIRVARVRERKLAVSTDDDLRLAGYEFGHLAQLLVDRDTKLSAANQHARTLFGVRNDDLGRPFHELEVSYRPLELRSRIEQVNASKEQLIERGVEMANGADVGTYDFFLIPMIDAAGEVDGISISVVETTAHRRVERELQELRFELETAYEELQSTVEELETTNEELQSTNEELETMNEELQSTNEELETMNEELQSTNEELETTNEELRIRTTEVHDANSFLEAVLSSLQSAVIVVNRDMEVQVWSQHAQELWGVRADEVEGEHLMNLDIGLPVQELHRPVRSALAGETDIEFTLDCINRRGRSLTCRIRTSPLQDDQGNVTGAILLIDGLASPAD